MYPCCACDLENNGILFCEEFTWKCEWVSFYSTQSQSKGRLFASKSKMPTNTMNKILQMRLLMARNWVSKVPYEERRALHCSYHLGACKGCYEFETGTHGRWQVYESRSNFLTQTTSNTFYYPFPSSESYQLSLTRDSHICTFIPLQWIHRFSLTTFSSA